MSGSQGLAIEADENFMLPPPERIVETGSVRGALQDLYCAVRKLWMQTN
jgi:hypothetical protein